jgi:anti-sigma-K factor RskA
MDIKEYISSGIIESFVMGLCTADEEKEILQLRLKHPELNQAIIAFEIEMENNMLQQATMPDEAVDNRIIAKLDTISKQAPVLPLQQKKKDWIKKLAVAASVLFIISAGLNFYLYQQTKRIAATSADGAIPPTDFQVLNNPAITPIAMYGVGSHTICRCTMFWDKKTGKVYVMIHHLPKSSSSKDFQLWATVNGKAVSVGIVQDEIRGKFIEMNNMPAGATSFRVTLEKAGGNISPTLDETYLEGRI